MVLVDDQQRAADDTRCTDDTWNDKQTVPMTSSAAAYTSRIVAVLGESLGWHVKNWPANRISKVGRFRRAAAACIDAVGPAVARPGDGWRCDGRMGRSGTPLDSVGRVSRASAR